MSIYKHLLTLSLFFTISSVQSQNGQEDSIIGSWTFDMETSFSQIDTQIAEHLAALPAVRSKMESVYRGKTITFSREGIYTQTLGDGRRNSGTWNITNSALVITMPEGQLFRYSFSVGGGILVLMDLNQTQQSKNVLPRQYFPQI